MRRFKGIKPAAFVMALIVIVTVLFAATWTAADAAASKIDRTKAGSKNKVLVAWFSHTGTSEEIAKNIAEQTGGDLYRIEAKDAYAPGYGDGDRAKEEWQKDLRPEIKNPPESMDDYDRIILCYPIWWHLWLSGHFLRAAVSPERRYTR